MWIDRPSERRDLSSLVKHLKELGIERERERARERKRERERERVVYRDTFLLSPCEALKLSVERESCMF